MAKADTLSRDTAMNAKPVAVQVVGREDLGNGGQRLTVEYQSTGWRRWLLRAPENLKRQFELDPLGLQVFEMCDGQKNVRHIIDRFAKHNNVNRHEAQRAVTTFLRTLMQKGVVQMMIHDT
ncbi:MAG: PqqD family protein [Phycisphaeraceae bacterium]|nr:PqqD family protein [Phycisphaeraceae bacterium]MDP7347995.1 PqqD family protein [Phycisphaeraceae bacterium]